MRNIVKPKKKNVQKLAVIFKSHKPSTNPNWNTQSVFLIMIEATIVISELIYKLPEHRLEDTVIWHSPSTGILRTHNVTS